MDIKNFILEITKTLAWPLVAVLTIVILLRGLDRSEREDAGSGDNKDA